jgi:hypothetical protein
LQNGRESGTSSCNWGTHKIKTATFGWLFYFVREQENRRFNFTL